MVRRAARTRAQIEGVERLGDVIDRSQVQPDDLVLGRGRAGEEEDRDHAKLGIGFQIPADLEAGDVGHVEIEEDQVGVLLSGGLQSEESAFRANDFQFLLCQPRFRDLQSVGIVVDDQNLHGAVLSVRAWGAYPR